MEKNHIIKIFVVEDDDLFGSVIQNKLEMENNYEVALFTSGEEFLKNLHLNPDIVTLDYNLPDITGIEILKKINTYNKSIATVILSGQNTVEVVVEAYKNGAKDYIIKNENSIVELANSVKNLSLNVSLRKEIDDLKDQIIDRSKYDKVIGESKAILNTIKLLQKIEKSNIMAMITGESGTGKEVIAKTIHYNSGRKREPFIAINVAAIPEDLIESELFGHEKGAFTGADSKRIGKFEESNGGTILLDEIGEMDVTLQTKLLRVLQENTITRLGSNKEIKLDVRVIAATNKNLAERVKEGKFREDLYYRLQGILIHLPPLRDRGNDIILLARHFMGLFCTQNKIAQKTFAKDALEKMMSYNWPGNVRELKALVERAVLISETDKVCEDDLMFSQELYS